VIAVAAIASGIWCFARFAAQELDSSAEWFVDHRFGSLLQFRT
jgi:hypothetical protein